MSSCAASTNINKKKVAIVGRLDSIGGVQSVILSLIRGLNDHGITPDLVWDVPPNPSLLKSKKVHANFCQVHFPVPSKFLDRVPTTVRYILRLADMLSEQNIPESYDFIYIFYNGFLISNGTPHVRYLSGPPLLPQLDMVSPGLRGMPYRFFRMLYKRYLHQRYPVYEFHRDSNYVINSQFTAELFWEAHGVQLPVVYPPIDLSGFDFTPGDLANRDTITYFSRFSDYKRPEMVIALAARHPEHRFVLMGGVKPYLRQFFESLQKYVEQNGLRNVHLFENPDSERVTQELLRTRFYIFPGKNEHFGMATAEAIASGAIPYVHNSGGQREVVPDPRLRFVDDCFFECFDRLMGLPEHELEEIRAGLRDHVHQFSEDAFNEKMLSFIGYSMKESD